MLDKNSGQMEVYNAEIFNMQPLLSGGRCWGSQLLSCFVLLISALFPWHGVRTIPSLLHAERNSRRGKHSESGVEVKQGLWRMGVTHRVSLLKCSLVQVCSAEGGLRLIRSRNWIPEKQKNQVLSSWTVFCH